jgi:hypothetical protein
LSASLRGVCSDCEGGLESRAMKRIEVMALLWVGMCLGGCHWHSGAGGNSAKTPVSAGASHYPHLDHSTSAKLDSEENGARAGGKIATQASPLQKEGYGAALAPPATTRAARSRVTDAKTALSFLASDELEGRGIGSKGLARAGDFVAEQFERVGLKTAPGMKDFFQRFEMTTAAEVGKGTMLSVQGSGSRSYEMKKDFIPLSFSAEKEFSGDVVFAGYGISSEKYGYDDYVDLDVKGKVVLVLRFEPHDEKGKSRFTGDDWSSEAHLTTKAKVAQARGRSGLEDADRED